MKLCQLNTYSLIKLFKTKLDTYNFSINMLGSIENLTKEKIFLMS